MSTDPTPDPARVTGDADRDFLLGLHGYGPCAVNAVDALPLDVKRLQAHTERALAAKEAECVALRTDLEHARQQLCAGPDKVLRCAFCGHHYPEGTPEAKSQMLADHIRVCEVHPIGRENRQLRAQRDLYLAERDSNAALAFEWAKKQGLAVADKINAEKREAKLRADLHNLHRYCKGAPVIQEMIEAALSASRKEMKR